MERRTLRLDEDPHCRVLLKADTELVQLRLPIEAARIVIENPMAARATLQRGAGEALLATVARRGALKADLLELRDTALSAAADLNIDDSSVWEGIGYTPWYTDAPPCSGYWQIRQKSARDTTVYQTPWYYADRREWFGPGWVAPIPHTQLMMSHFWRGLKAPHPDGYTYLVPGQRVRMLA